MFDIVLFWFLIVVYYTILGKVKKYLLITDFYTPIGDAIVLPQDLGY
jgi:hypothetical protein